MPKYDKWNPSAKITLSKKFKEKLLSHKTKCYNKCIKHILNNNSLFTRNRFSLSSAYLYIYIFIFPG